MTVAEKRHRLKECLKLEGPQWVVWPNLSAQAGPLRSTWHRIVSRQFLDISAKEDPTAFLDNLFQCTVTCTVKKFILISRQNFCCCYCSFCYLIAVSSNLFLSQPMLVTFCVSNSQLHPARVGREDQASGVGLGEYRWGH